MNDYISQIENKIIESKTPLILLCCVFNNEKINDENKSIVVKLFFKHHINLALEYNLIELYLENNNSDDFPLTYNLLIDIYLILSKQIIFIQNIKNFKKSYINKFFWMKNIDEQILYLKNLHQQLLSIFDGSKSGLYFHLKLKNINNNLGENYHIEQIIERLRKVVSLFKLAFFKEHEIYILSNIQFMDLKFENMIRYTEYIFYKINNILNKYISSFEHYEYFRKELINLLNISNSININIIDVNSDIDIDDLELF